jgi:hypothetical protein
MALSPHEEEATRALLLAEQQRLADAQLDAIVRVNSQVYEKAVAHTNAIVLGGYAALFTAWGFGSKVMSPGASALAGTLTTISCLVFVLWEVFKAFNTGRAFNQVARHVAEAPAEAVRLLIEYEAEQQARQLLLARWWYGVLLVTLTTGVGAAVTFAWAFVSQLFDKAA